MTDPVGAAVAVARDLGLGVADPVVLRHASNLLVHLRPAPVVARVATATGSVRPGTAWLEREVAVAGFLAAAGAPVIAPADELPPGPHERDGLAISFWRLVEERGQVDPVAAGAALRACHDALARHRGPLPELAGPREGLALLDRLLDEGETFRGDDAALVRRAATRVTTWLDSLAPPLRPIHGDSHLGNALATARGPLWGDWEDTFLGPLEWDLACLLTPSAVMPERDPARARAALEAHGAEPDADALDAAVEARALQLTAWTVIIARAHPDRPSRLPRYLDWLRARE